jgi:hypothetical protein
MPSVNLNIQSGGPLINALVGVSNPRFQALTAAGQTPPTGVMGTFLIDTGASCTCIDPDLIRGLAIQPTSSRGIGVGSIVQLGMTRNRNSGRVRFCADHSSMMEANHGLHRHAAALAKAVFNLSGAVPCVRISDTLPDRGRRRALDIRLFRVR